jgi:hypothetical protein
LRSVLDGPGFLSSGVGSESIASSLAYAYDQAMAELHSDILAATKSGNMRNLHAAEIEAVENEWRVIRNHPRGGAFVRKLNEDLALEVHVVYPFN